MEELTDEILIDAVRDVDELTTDDILTLAERCPYGFARLVAWAVQALNDDPKVECVAAVLAVGFAAGWKAAEHNYELRITNSEETAHV